MIYYRLGIEEHGIDGGVIPDAKECEGWNFERQLFFKALIFKSHKTLWRIAFVIKNKSET